MNIAHRGLYSGLNLNQDKATKPQTVQIVRQGEATPYWFKFNPLYNDTALPTPLCTICTQRALSPCLIFILIHYTFRHSRAGGNPLETLIDGINITI